LRAKSPEAAQLTWACADALDSNHLDTARARCADALSKDEDIALLHVLLAQLHPADVARKELQRADELARRASPGEKLFVDAKRAALEGRTADARRLFDALVGILPGEPRALVARARFLREALRDADGAVADLQRAVERDPKYGVAHGLLAMVQLDRGQLDAALAAAKKYVEVEKSEPSAQIMLARVHLRRGELAEASSAAKRAVALDEKLPASRLFYGDLLVFGGKGKEARAQYGALLASQDGPTHHDAAMRDARSYIFEGEVADAERALYAESELADRAKRPADQVDALVELARLQLDRSAVAEAGQTLRRAQEVLGSAENGAAISAEARRRLGTEIAQVRAMILAAVGERQLAEARMSELLAQWKLDGDPQAEAKVAALRGWVAARNHDDKTALAQLGGATRPTLRLALALAAQRAGDVARARTIMEELAKATENELEVALTRPRALVWLKANRGVASAPTPPPPPPPSTAAKPPEPTAATTETAPTVEPAPKGKGKKRKAAASESGLPHKKPDPYSSSTALPPSL
jgi:predicted Zn-dependent protease